MSITPTTIETLKRTSPAKARGWKFHNIKLANAEIARLEAELAKQKSAPPAAPVPATSRPEPAKSGPTLDQKRQIARLLNVVVDASGNFNETQLEKSAYQSGVHFAGMPDDETLSKKLWRKDEWTGAKRLLRAELQERIDSILAVK